MKVTWRQPRRGEPIQSQLHQNIFNPQKEERKQIFQATMMLSLLEWMMAEFGIYRREKKWVLKPSRVFFNAREKFEYFSQLKASRRINCYSRYEKQTFILLFFPFARFIFGSWLRNPFHSTSFSPFASRHTQRESSAAELLNSRWNKTFSFLILVLHPSWAIN